MKQHIKLIVFLLAVLLVGCDSKTSFEGIWLGAAFEMDKEVYVPFPRLMIAESDGRFNAYNLGKPDTNWSTWSIERESLKIDTITYPPTAYELTANEFHYLGTFKGYYRKLTNPEKFEKEALLKTLNNSSWKSEYDRIYFDKSGELRVQTTKQEKGEKLCWSIVQDQGFTFLIKKGNQQGCAKVNRYPELVQSISNDQFTIERWQGSSWKEIIYTRTSKEKNSIALDDFQLCNPYLYRNNPTHRYYYKYTFYKGGIYKINKLFNEFYKAPEGISQNGTIKVEFIVNCQGKPGRYSMMQFNEDYELKDFPKEISKQIFDFTQTLTEWNAGKDKNGAQIDTYRFLSFRIKNGQVVEIFP